MRAILALLCVVGVTVRAVATPVEGPPRELTAPDKVFSPSLPGARALPIEDLFKSARSYSAVWSADGRSIVYSSSQSGRMNIWSQPLSGAAAVQLSHSEDRQQVHSVSSDGRWMFFYADHEGREISDLYVLPTAGGKEQNLTDTDDVNEMSPIVSHDGKFLAFVARDKNQSSGNVAVMDLETHKTRRLTHESTDGVQWEVIAVSGDGRFIIANRHDWGLKVGDAYRIDVASGAARRLTPEGIFAQASDLSPDGRHVSVSVESPKGMQQAELLELTTGRSRALAPGPWDQKAGHFSPDGRTLLIVSNVDGRESVFAYDLKTSKLQQLPFPAGINSNGPYVTTLPAFSPDSRRILFPHSSGAEPDDYWVYELDKAQAHRATRMAAIDSKGLPSTQIVHFKSTDGTVISALLWMPYNLKRDHAAPAIVLTHGGPTGQVSDQFDRKAAALASRGYVVLAPNFRGSTGYGRAFLNADRKDLGGGDLQDVVAGARFLIETGYVDAKKIGISGGSYGGYMTLMALGKTPDVWAAGVEEFGPVNLRTAWELSPPQNRGYLRDLVGDPNDNSELYDRLSPLTYLHQARAPLLVLQGENDPRVPASEAHQVVDYLLQHDRVVAAHFYPGEGHGYVKRENQIDALQRLVAWFDHYLKGQGPGTPPSASP